MEKMKPAKTNKQTKEDLDTKIVALDKILEKVNTSKLLPVEKQLKAL